MMNPGPTRSVGVLCLFLLAMPAQAQQQPVYYNTSSANQSQNALYSVATNGSPNTALFSASGAVSRCTAVAVDGLNGKLFFVDGQSNSIWRVNVDGSGLTLIKSNLTQYVVDLALDVLNQRIFFTTSSAVQTNNTVQRLDYAGTGSNLLFIATGPTINGGNGVSRCTALDVDLANSRIFVADAGAGKIWGLNLTGGALTAIATTTNCYPTGVALDPTNQQVYFTASAAAQSSNFVQRVNYNGSGLITRFAASGSSVQRCTALDLDLAHSIIYLSDAGANTLWRIPLGGGAATSVLSGVPATAKKVRWFDGPNARPAPGIAKIQISATNAVFNVTNGFIGGTYYLLTSTNVMTPLNQWVPILTNALSVSGNFTLTASNSFSLSTRQRFYVVAVH